MGSRGDGGDSLKTELGQVLAGHFAECLAFFGRVDSADPDSDLLVGAGLVAAGGQGVAVSNGDDEAE